MPAGWLSRRHVGPEEQELTERLVQPEARDGDWDAPPAPVADAPGSRPGSRRAVVLAACVVLLAVAGVAVGMALHLTRAPGAAQDDRRLPAAVCTFTPQNFSLPRIEPAPVPPAVPLATDEELARESLPSCSGAPLEPDTVVGSLPVHTRTEGGQLALEIPLKVPRGAAGFQPGLTISYSSAGGNGVLGSGWSITAAGTSAIWRRAPNLVDHGRTAPVRYDTSDVFYYGSQALVPLGNATTAAQGLGEGLPEGAVEFRTSVYNSMRFVAYNATRAAGPTRWVAYGNNGEVATLGGTTDSQVLHPENGAVVIYEVSSVQDRFGNEVAHTYEHDRANGDWWRTSISYAGNASVVRFGYEARLDDSKGWAAGLPVRTGRRLAWVQTLALSVLNVSGGAGAHGEVNETAGPNATAAVPNGTEPAAPNSTAAPVAPTEGTGPALVPLLTYTFNYSQSGLSGASLLQSVRLCDGCSRTCMPPVTFEYAAGATTPEVSSFLVPSAGAGAPAAAVAMGTSRPAWFYDFDCDANPAKTKVLLGNQTQHRAADLNQDARDDLLVTHVSCAVGVGYISRLSRGNGTFGEAASAVFQPFAGLPCSDNGDDGRFSTLLGDMNNDGRIDLVAVWLPSAAHERDHVSAPFAAVALGGGDGTFAEPSVFTSLLPANVSLAADYPANCSGSITHGDAGIDNDIVITCADTKGLRAIVAPGDGKGGISAGTSSQLSAESFNATTHPLTVLTPDLSGSGWVDVVAVYAGPEGIRVTVASSERGDGAFGKAVTTSLSSADVGEPGSYTVQFAKFNGAQDLLLQRITKDGGWEGYLATGHGDYTFEPATHFVVTTDNLAGAGAADGFEPSLDDVNGDGRTDLVATNAKGGAGGLAVHVALSQVTGGFAPPALVVLSDTMPASTDNDVVSLFTADVDGDGRNDYGQYNTHLPPCDKSPFTSSVRVVLTPRATAGERLVRVRSAQGAFTDVQYGLLTDPAVYTHTGADVARYVDHSHVIPNLQASFVVTGLLDDNGIGGATGSRLTYTDYAVDLKRGALGFAAIATTHTGNGLRHVTHYWLRQPNPSLPSLQLVYDGHGVLLSNETSAWTIYAVQQGQPSHPYRGAVQMIQQTGSVVHKFSEAGAWLSETTSAFQFDAFGNPTSSVVTVRDDQGTVHETTTSLAYRNDVSRWLIGLPVDANATYAISYADWPEDLLLDPASAQVGPDNRTWAVTRQRGTHRYDDETGAAVEETRAPGTAHETSVSTEHDASGNPVVVTTRARGSQAQRVTAAYDPTGRFKLRTCKFENEPCERFVVGAASETVREYLANGHVIDYRYDTLGRQTRATNALEGLNVTTHKAFCRGAEPEGATAGAAVDCSAFPDAVSVVVTDPPGEAETVEYRDRLGRPVGSLTHAGNKTVQRATRYGAHGQIAEETLPTFTGQPAVSMSYTPDELGRVRQVINSAALERTLTVRHDGSRTTVTDPVKEWRSVTRNAMDWIVSSTSSWNQTLRYWYDARGNVLGVRDDTDAARKTWLTRVAYDSDGNKVKQYLPSRGVWSYRHDSKKRIVEQTDANGNRMTWEWDQRDRLAKQTYPEGETTYTYDRVFPDKVASMRGPPPTSLHDQYEYSERGAILKWTRSFTLNDLDAVGLAGNSSIDVVEGGCRYRYVHQYRYDAHNRPVTTIYPTGRRVDSVYDDLGFLVRQVDVSSGKTLWRLEESDALGNTLRATFGNGLRMVNRYDEATGALIARRVLSPSGKVLQDESHELDVMARVSLHRDNLRNLTESFLYNEVGEVVSAVTRRRGEQVHAMRLDYDRHGRLTYKSGVGTLRYDDDLLHAVAAVEPDTGAAPYAFQYDRNGNRVSGNGTRIEYNSFNKPVTVVRGAQQSHFTYTPDGEVLLRRDVIRLQPWSSHAEPTSIVYRTTVSVSSLYESVTTRRPFLEAFTESRHIVSPGAIIVDRFTPMPDVAPATAGAANRRRETYTDGNVTHTSYVQYIHADLKGATAFATDERGALTYESSHDVCGTRRSVSDWVPQWQRGNLSDTPLTWDEARVALNGSLGSEGTMSFGGRTELIDLEGGFVHMGGRLYDATHFGFTSADAFVKDLYSRQSWDAYAYLERGLAGMDPSGFGFFSHVFKSITKAVSHVFKAVGHLISNVVKSVVKFLRNNPIFDTILTAVIDHFALALGPAGFLLAAGWDVLNAKMMGASWSQALMIGAKSLVGDFMGTATNFIGNNFPVLKDVLGGGGAMSPWKTFLKDVGMGAAKAAVDGKDPLKGAVMGAVGFAADEVGSIIDNGQSFTVGSFSSSGASVSVKIVYSRVLAMAANGAIRSAAATAINGGSVGETLEAGLLGGLRAGASETASEVKNMLPTLKVMYHAYQAGGFSGSSGTTHKTYVQAQVTVDLRAGFEVHATASAFSGRLVMFASGSPQVNKDTIVMHVTYGGVKAFGHTVSGKFDTGNLLGVKFNEATKSWSMSPSPAAVAGEALHPVMHMLGWKE